MDCCSARAVAVHEPTWKGNKEGEMPEAPLPFDSTHCWSRAELIGTMQSPPCQAVASVMSYFGIPFELSKISFPFDKKALKKSPEYKKIPILFLDNIQINDSLIIARVLCELKGVYLSPADIDLLTHVNRNVMVAMEGEFMGRAPKSVQTRWINTYAPDSWAITKAVTPLFFSHVASNIQKKRPDLPRFKKTLAPLGQRLQERGPYFGGSSMNAVDAYIFGVLIWLGLGHKKYLQHFLKTAGLSAWYAAVEAQHGAFIKVCQSHL